jgi:hypothetical protein
MSNRDLFSRVVIVVVLGDRSLSIAHGKAHAAARKNTGHIVIDEPKGRRKPSTDESRCLNFIQKVKDLYDKGDRLIFVTGYPTTPESARDLKILCPNLIVFSIEDMSQRKYEIFDLRSGLSLSKHYFQVDSRRSHKSRHNYMEGRITNFLLEFQVSVGAKSIATSSPSTTSTRPQMVAA